MTVLHFFLDNGIGQNVTAGVLSLVVGWFWSKTRFWPLNLLSELHASHKELHAKLDALQAQHAELRETIEKRNE